MPGEPITLVGDTGGRIESFVSALARFPTEPRWALIGGFAVNVRIAEVHRLTNDIDTVSHDQASLVEILLAEPDAEGLSAAKLRFTRGDLPVDIDVMGDMADVPLAGEPSEQAFTLARRMALATSEILTLLVVDGDGKPTARATTPVATVGALIALKAVAIPRRSASNNPQKVGSDIHDLVRLVQSCEFETVIDAITTAGGGLQTWVSTTLVKWFSPDHDLRYTFARMTRLAERPTPRHLSRPTSPSSPTSATPSREQPEDHPASPTPKRESSATSATAPRLCAPAAQDAIAALQDLLLFFLLHGPT